MSGVFSYGRGSSLVWAERLEFPRPPGQQILRQVSCATLSYDGIRQATVFKDLGHRRTHTVYAGIRPNIRSAAYPPLTWNPLVWSEKERGNERAENAAPIYIFRGT